MVDIPAFPTDDISFFGTADYQRTEHVRRDAEPERWMSRSQFAKTAEATAAFVNRGLLGDLTISNSDVETKAPAHRPEVPAVLGRGHQSMSVPDTTPLGASKQFDDMVNLSLRSLPQKLQNALNGYSIYTSSLPDQFLLELRNRGISVELDERNEVRKNAAMTQEQLRLQNFSEWHKNPYSGRYMNFGELYNLRGTIAHEAEHALDNELGQPSQLDAVFDQLYQQDVAAICSQHPDALQYLGHFVVVDQHGNLDAAAGKREIFAELGAILHVGESSNRVIPAEYILAFFPRLSQYVKQQIAAGSW